MRKMEFYPNSQAPGANTPYGLFTNESAAGAQDGVDVIAEHMQDLYYALYQVMLAAGVVPNDTLENGTSNKQFLDALKIYIESLATGGGGGGIEAVAIKNALEKIGVEYPLPSNDYINESYVSDKIILAYLREAYTAGTTIYFDHGFNDSLLIIDDMDATTGWSASGGGSVSLDSSVKQQGGASVKHSLSVFTGTAFIQKTVAVNLTDLHGRVGVKISGVSDIANISSLKLRYKTDASNYVEFSFVPDASFVSSGSPSGFKTLTLDLDDSSAFTETGTFFRDTITIIELEVTATSTETFDVNWDFLTGISNIPLLVEDYGFTYVVEDSTNQEILTVIAENRTSNETKGSFTLAAALGNSYGTDYTESYIASSTLLIENGQGQIKPTAAGQGAKAGKHIRTLCLGEDPVSGSFDVFHRFIEDPFDVSDLSSFGSGILKIAANSDVSARFKNNKPIVIYKDSQVSARRNTLSGSSSINFWVLLQSTDGAFASNEVTLNYDQYLDLDTGSYVSGFPSLGSDLTNYKVIPLSASLEYVAGAKTSSAVLSVTPKELILNRNKGALFEDDFNRIDGAVGNDWIVSTTGTNTTFLQIVSNELYQANISTNTNGTSTFSRTLPISVFGNVEVSIKTKWNGSSDGWTYQNGIDLFRSSSSVAVNDGLRVYMGAGFFTTTINKLFIYWKGVLIANPVVTFTKNTYYNLKVIYRAGKIKVKFWLATAAEPTTSIFEIRVTPTAEIGNFHGIYCNTGATSAREGYSHIDDYKISDLTGGLTLRGAVDVVDINKIEEINTVEREDVVNQDPVSMESGLFLAKK